MKKYFLAVLMYLGYLVFLEIILSQWVAKGDIAAIIGLTIPIVFIPLILLLIAFSRSRLALTLFSVAQILAAAILALFIFLASDWSYTAHGPVSRIPFPVNIVLSVIIAVMAIAFILYFGKKLPKPYAPSSKVPREKTPKYLAGVHIFSVFIILSFVSPILMSAVAGLLFAFGLIETSSVSQFFMEGIKIDNKVLQVSVNVVSQVIFLWLGIWASARFYVNRHFTTQDSVTVVTLSTKYYALLVVLGIIASVVELFGSTPNQMEQQITNLILTIVQSILAVFLFYFFSKKYIGSASIQQAQTANSNTNV